MTKKIIGIILFIIIFSIQAQAQPLTLAVMDFRNSSQKSHYDHLQRAVAEMLKTELSQCPEIAVLERGKIESLLREYALAQAGVVETKHAQELGKLAGAEYIITGEIQQVSGDLRLDAHLIRVSTGQILGEKVTGRGEKNLQAMVHVLGQNIIFDLTGKGRHLREFKIHDYKVRYFAGATAALALATLISHLDYEKNYDKYHQATDFEDFDSYYNRANRSHKIRNFSLTLTACAAITTFSLWSAEKSRSNKVFADRLGGSALKLAQIFDLSVNPAEKAWQIGMTWKF